jgi:hypothetical protein
MICFSPEQIIQDDLFSPAYLGSEAVNDLSDAGAGSDILTNEQVSNPLLFGLARRTRRIGGEFAHLGPVSLPRAGVDAVLQGGGDDGGHGSPNCA